MPLSCVYFRSILSKITELRTLFDIHDRDVISIIESWATSANVVDATPALDAKHFAPRWNRKGRSGGGVLYLFKLLVLVIPPQDYSCLAHLTI